MALIVEANRPLAADEQPSWTLRRWSEAGSAPSLRPHPAANLEFYEGRSAWFEKPGDGWQLLVDDGALPTSSEDPTKWIWKPGFFAGEVTAVLQNPLKEVVAYYLLDVSPNPEKSGRRAFEEMIDELRELAPSLLVGTEPPTLSSGVLGEHVDPTIEFARLRRFVPDLLKTLDQIRSRPIRTLRADRGNLPANQVRRIDQVTARSALGDASALAFLDPRTSEGAQPTVFPRFNVPLVEETHDSAANRCLVALARGIFRRARWVAERVEATVQKIDDHATRTDLSTRWSVRKAVLLDLERRMAEKLRKPPFREVTRAEITAAGLNAIASHPLYARAWRLGWKAMRPGVEGAAEDDRLWTSPTWEVYERWCFARLANDLAAIRPDLSWTGVEFGKAGADARATGVGAGETIEILFQASFPPHVPSSASGFYSISKTRYPDIVITHQLGQTRRFAVLDAKYRVTRSNVVDAMDSAHLYHDSLRWGGERPWRSLLLVPRGGGAAWLEAQPFWELHDVGVAELCVDTEGIELLKNLGLLALSG